MIQWAEGVNQRVMKETNWDTPTGVVGDDTRCGRKKTRFAQTCQPQVYNVTLKMSVSEKILFLNWFNNKLFKGAESFAFPKIDDNSKTLTEYRFVAGSSIKWSNNSGVIMTASMQWEEV